MALFPCPGLRVNPMTLSCSTQELLNVLKRRLAMDNVHKQWLAILLVSDVLERCPNAVRVRIPKGIEFEGLEGACSSYILQARDCCSALVGELNEVHVMELQLTASGRQEILGCVAEVAKHPSNKTQGPHGETLVQSIRKVCTAWHIRPDFLSA